ncbi:hypothetical protein HRbin33_00362 [bacterium HR33]|nr:hypothetical protein HRbin33_00362 [bacterium HR33]
MNRWLAGGFALLLLWVWIAFIAAWPSGWAHLPLAAGVVLIAVGIVRSDPGNDAER